MRRSRLPSVARQLLAEVPDADLLERYVLHRADDAFAQLVTRYSRLVWGQCRNLLPSEADADDAFQATFLTLARSAKKLKPEMPLGPWLHGVAYRVCMNARRALGRRAKHEKANAKPEANRPVAESDWETAFAAVSEEVQKLPEAQRSAFVLCCIEGRTAQDAADSLGVRVGTLATRLSRAKQTLVQGLAKQGIGAGLLALGGVAGNVAVAPAALVARTVALVPSGVSVPSSIHALTQGVTGMAMIRFKLLAAGVLVATGLGLSFGGGWSNSATAQVAAPPAKTAPGDEKKLDELKALLDKAKADLAKAEADLAEKRLIEERVRAWEFSVELTKIGGFEYEPVPAEGFPAKEFEAKILDREKAGWHFLGQVTLQKGKTSIPMLAFRKQQAISVVPPTPKTPSVNLPVGPKPPAPDAIDPSIKPKPPAPPAPPARPSGSLPAPADPFITPPTPPLPTNKLEADYKAKIAVLEEELRKARGSKVIEETQQVSLIRVQPSSGWNAKDLADVIGAIMSKDAGKKFGPVALNVQNDMIYVTGSSQACAEVTAWVQKLKKTETPAK